MTPNLTFNDLLEYTGWQRAKWAAWFRAHPEALGLSAGPNGDGRFGTIGDLVKHIFGAEQRYVQRLRGEAVSDFADIRSDDVDAVYGVGEKGRRELARLIEQMSAQEWETPREFRIMTFRVVATPKKFVMHSLLHEIRHWAQISTLCRVNGLAVESHDFLAAPVWGGEFGPA